MLIRNPKSEIRISKQFQNPNVQNAWFVALCFGFWSFGFGILSIIQIDQPTAASRLRTNPPFQPPAAGPVARLLSLPRLGRVLLRARTAASRHRPAEDRQSCSRRASNNPARTAD